MLTWFHDERRIYLVVEFAAGGELYKHLTNSPHGRFPEPRAAKSIYQVKLIVYLAVPSPTKLRCYLTRLPYRNL